MESLDMLPEVLIFPEPGFTETAGKSSVIFIVSQFVLNKIKLKFYNNLLIETVGYQDCILPKRPIWPNLKYGLKSKQNVLINILFC